MSIAFIGGIALSDGMAMASNKNKGGRLEIFFMGGNAQLYYKYQTQPGWSSWVSLGSPSKGFFLSPVTASIITNAKGYLGILALGGDGQLYYKQQGISGWSNWITLGGPPRGGFLSSAAVSIISNPDGHMEVFTMGGDGQLYHNWQRSDSWSGWSSLGKP